MKLCHVSRNRLLVLLWQLCHNFRTFALNRSMLSGAIPICSWRFSRKPRNLLSDHKRRIRADLILDKPDHASAPVVRRPFLAGYHYPLHHRSPSQVFADQPQHPLVPDRSSDPAHQNVVIDVVEEFADVLALERFQRPGLSPDKLWFGECPWSTPPSPSLPAHTSARPAWRPVLCVPAETRNCAH